MIKKIAVVVAIIGTISGACCIGAIRAKHLEEYAERNNCTWTYYYDEPICK